MATWGKTVATAIGDSKMAGTMLVPKKGAVVTDWAAAACMLCGQTREAIPEEDD